jgi:hypothetical protein
MSQDGRFFVDRLPPFNVADFGSVAPGTTATTLWPVGATSPTILPANFWIPGRCIRIKAFFKWTSGTAGNITIGASYGAASNPACIVNSVATAAVASVGPFGVFVEAYYECRTVGTAGTLSMWGMATAPVGLITAATGADFVFPNAGVTVVSTIDTTVATNACMIHGIRSAGTDGVVCAGLVMESVGL